MSNRTAKSFGHALSRDKSAWFQNADAGSRLRLAKSFFKGFLPKRIMDPTQPDGYRLAMPGEMKSVNGIEAVEYDPFHSNIDLLDEFGIGIGIYFRTLKAICIFLAVGVCAITSTIISNSKFNPSPETYQSHRNVTRSFSTITNGVPWYLNVGTTLGARREGNLDSL